MWYISYGIPDTTWGINGSDVKCDRTRQHQSETGQVDAATGYKTPPSNMYHTVTLRVAWATGNNGGVFVTNDCTYGVVAPPNLCDISTDLLWDVTMPENGMTWYAVFQCKQTSTVKILFVYFGKKIDILEEDLVSIYANRDLRIRATKKPWFLSCTVA